MSEQRLSEQRYGLSGRCSARMRSFTATHRDGLEDSIYKGKASRLRGQAKTKAAKPVVLEVKAETNASGHENTQSMQNSFYSMPCGGQNSFSVVIIYSHSNGVIKVAQKK